MSILLPCVNGITPASTVYHRPSKETWEVGAVDEYGRCIFPNGWPETLAYAADCELLELASEEESLQMIKRWAKNIHKSDIRHRLNASWLDRQYKIDCERMQRL